MKDWATGLFKYSTLTFDLCYNGKDEECNSEAILQTDRIYKYAMNSSVKYLRLRNESSKIKKEYERTMSEG